MGKDKLVFPSYTQMCAMNNEREYKGLELRIHMAENLYLRLECRNEDIILYNGKKKIYVAWCTHNCFPIASETYLNCKEGYDEALKFLFNTAKVFQKTFADFVDTATVVK